MPAGVTSTHLALDLFYSIPSCAVKGHMLCSIMPLGAKCWYKPRRSRRQGKLAKVEGSWDDMARARRISAWDYSSGFHMGRRAIIPGG